ncbi:MAG: hypothetical protein JXD18_00735 [Anaerolineae bacterium]|nr:hypothetical protein [Anaerolineae bacterium]
MTRVFVRERRHVRPGTGRPRFAVVAVEGSDLHFFRPSLRRKELEQIAEAIGAEVVYLSESGERHGHNRPHHHEAS